MNRFLLIGAIAFALFFESFVAKSKLFPPFSSGEKFLVFASKESAFYVDKKRRKATNETYPVWPKAFSSTLAKLGPDDNQPVYTKLFFDYPYSRFVFYEHYFSMNKT